MADTSRSSAAPEPRLSGTEIVAVLLSIAWLVVAGAYFLFAGSGEDETSMESLRFVVTLLAIFLPVAVIWVAASAARASRVVREESQRLQAAVDGLRQTYLADRQARGSGIEPSVEKKLNEIAASARKTESALATFTSSRQSPRVAALPDGALPEPGDHQPSLELGTSAEEITPPLPRADLIRALNFPDTADDEAGFAALRRALRDRNAAQLIQASQDVLTLLSHDGIYMDDLRPDRARPEIWRRFAQGERGGAIGALGGVRDRSCLALTAGRMREDAIFRDTAHHFLRRFDQMLQRIEPEATEEDLAALSETRTARAFMLLGRVTGAFD